MNILDNHSSLKLLIVGAISSIFVVYPNIANLLWELSFLDESKHVAHLTFFFIRYVYFLLLIWWLLFYNLKKIKDFCFKDRAIRTFLTTFITYVVFVFFMYLWNGKLHGFGSLLLFQFFVVFILSSFVGHVVMMYNVQRKKEQEIENLKIENLQSRCNALANQIDPHFFFNSLNSLTALIRKKEDENTLAFVNKLSDVFRYILQSDKKGLVTLDEELEFVEAFRYMMEVRFANKFEFKIRVDENKLNLKIPVLSLLPLIDNVVVHNTIDSQHKMEVRIFLNEQCELVVSNPVFPKLTSPITNGTGIKNLENRFLIMMNKQIRVENTGDTYSVYLPLK
jgi:Putative regulator of cell autolysis